MAESSIQQKAQAAWDRIEALGGHGVWDDNVVYVILAGTEVTDKDMAIFRDFPFVQLLDLSHTRVGDGALDYLDGLKALETLIVVGAQMTGSALEAFRRAHPHITVTEKKERPPQGAINPFTGKPF